MIEDRFTLLLKELSEQLKIELKPDQNNSCLLSIKEQLKVQLELDPSHQDLLIIGSDLGQLSPGKFREEILLITLKANAKPYPRMGDFAYSTKLNSLILFEVLNIQHLSTDNILSILTPFIHKAFAWKDALDRSEIPTHLLNMDYANEKNDNIFGT